MPNNLDALSFWSNSTPQAFKSYHTLAAGTVVITAVPALVHTLTINTFAASETIALYDSATAAGTTAANCIASIITTSAQKVEMPLNAVYDVGTKNGLVLVTTGTADINVSYLP